MSNYAILRFAKLKSFQEIGKVGAHNHRSKNVLNANPDLSSQNQYSDSEKLTDKVKRNLEGVKVRKNAVLAVECLMTFSPEWWERIKQEKSPAEQTESLEAWKNQSLEWLEKTAGAGNVVDWALHMDETTPHIQAVFIPFDLKGKLNCRDLLGGAEKLSALQDSYFESVKNLDLKRGQKKSKAKHTKISSYYSHINKTDQHLSKHLKQIDKRLAGIQMPSKLEALTNLEKWFDSYKMPMQWLRSLYIKIYRKNKKLENQISDLKFENIRHIEQIKSLESRFNNLVAGLGAKDFNSMSIEKREVIKKAIKQSIVAFDKDQASKLVQGPSQAPQRASEVDPLPAVVPVDPSPSRPGFRP